jgi:H2-forming N5,N10-methylenetetrahydromethanopterin dehydrogenase-like enzyme
MKSVCTYYIIKAKVIRNPITWIENEILLNESILYIKVKGKAAPVL